MFSQKDLPDLGMSSTSFHAITFPWQIYIVKNNFLTLAVLLSLSLFTLTTQVITTGTSSDLSKKVRVTAYKGDTFGAVNL